MPIEVYDDEYAVGQLCMQRHPSKFHQCRRPLNHEGKHQRKAAGIQWWFHTEGGYKTLYIETGKQNET